MIDAAPPWRRLDPRGPAARALALGAALTVALALAVAALAPLSTRIAAAERVAADVQARAAALERAALALAPPAVAPGAEATAAALAWLDAHAPRAGADAASLALLSALRAEAARAGVALTALTPLAPDSADVAALAPPAGTGLHLVAAEARLAADHAGLIALLGAMAAQPGGARVVALDIAAASAAPLREAGRLTVRLIAAGLRRDPPRSG